MSEKIDVKRLLITCADQTNRKTANILYWYGMLGVVGREAGDGGVGGGGGEGGESKGLASNEMRIHGDSQWPYCDVIKKVVYNLLAIISFKNILPAMDTIAA